MKKNLRFLTVILLAALCLLFAGCAEQAAEPDGSAQDLLNLNDGADEVPADDGLDDTADESYPAEEDLAAFAGTYTCRTQGAEWSDLEIYDDGSWTLYGTDATRTGTLVYEEEYEMYYAYNDADNSGCQFNRDESGEIYMGAYGYFVPTGAPSNEDAGGDSEYVDYEDTGDSDGYYIDDDYHVDISSFEGCWYYDGDLSADRYILIDAYGEWFYYARNEGDARIGRVEAALGRSKHRIHDVRRRPAHRRGRNQHLLCRFRLVQQCILPGLRVRYRRSDLGRGGRVLPYGVRCAAQGPPPEPCLRKTLPFPVKLRLIFHHSYIIVQNSSAGGLTFPGLLSIL